MSCDLMIERKETGIGSCESYPRSLLLAPHHRFGLRRVSSSLRASCPAKSALIVITVRVRFQGLG